MRSLLVFFGLLIASTTVAGKNHGFLIKNANLVQKNGDLLLNADIEFHFSENAIESLKNAVPLTISIQLNVLQERKYVWDQSITCAKLAFRIRYHALVELFQVINEDTGVHRNFATLESAIEALGALRGIYIMKANTLDKQHQYRAEIKVGLDVERLPLALRPSANYSPDWSLSSSWYRWTLENYK